MDTFRRLHAKQDQQEQRAYAALLTTAFVRAVTKRFAEHSSPNEIIDFVADARVRIVGPEAMVPEDAERVIRAALGEDDLINDMSGKAYGAAQVSVLFAITHENDSAADSIDVLLAQAADDTADYFHRRNQR